MSDSVAVLAGGCFWCIEPVFSQLRGVKKVVSGYIGGHVVNPSYKQVCTGTTGHTEGIEITFDSSQISFVELLEIFFISHDPTTPNRQGNDIGTQYRSAVFCQSEEQKSQVQAVVDHLNAEKIWPAPIVTEINDAAIFYPAEDYHQYYYANNINQPYCMIVAAPKVAKVRAKYADKIK
ncbi:peptide-methionine (S)-S-oxide reductase [Methylovorus sp. MM2]|uniref:peptide-methionine (S)-S-oxide reductase MsrA n=1 Tax=Methylovorus sp. MM2 TaxID=1848038 RepID=UPI0007E0D24D|nr:peptide-methionine (S)-S-oxide reductase MsrA [Methylovorus sp. MM2]OAM51160.1 peptide-methionine (S)-S-oxide reductase [Methylovorus sp. MM2]